MKEIKQQEFAVTSEKDLKEQFPNLSNEDFDFYVPKNKILDFEMDFISVRKYNNLVRKQHEIDVRNAKNPDLLPETLSDLELKQMHDFKNRNTKNPDAFKNEISYWEKILSNTKEEIVFTEGLVPDKKTLYNLFLKSYKYLNDVNYIVTEEYIKNIEPIIKYFSFDNDFHKCQNLILKCGNKTLKPSFNKGLLLIGNVGNGKTSIMKAMEFLIDFYFKKSLEEKWNTSGDWFRIKFKFATMESLVSEFEYLKTQEEKDIFFQNYSRSSYLFDDLKREKNASNYGITNVGASLLEKRYNNLKNYNSDNNKRVVTHGTMNFYEKQPNDVDFAIQECGVRYGSHVYDRIFEMFNIVEIKGKSQRR